MFEFISYLKDYVKDELEDLGILPLTFNLNVYDAYTVGHSPDKTEIQVQLMDFNEVDRYSTFEGENVSYMPTQITVIGFPTKLGGIMKSAREVSLILGEKVRIALSKLRESNVNDNIKRVRIMTMTPALPYQEGNKAYMTAIRCEFWVANPYINPITSNGNGEQ